jgi:two-component system cell cycle response regulator
MIATALSSQMNAHPVERQLTMGQNVLLASYDRLETYMFAAYLDDMYRLFLADTERRLLADLANHAIDMLIINTGPANIADGIRLCGRLKAASPSAHLPVVLLIPGNDRRATIDCLRAGADACMEKPLSRDHLRAQVRNLLANRSRLKCYFSQPFLCAIEPAVGTGGNLAFVNRLNEFILANLHDAELKVDALAQTMNMSLPTLYRKIRNLSKQTPNGLVNSIRLNKAAELLSTGEYKVFTIAKMVGFPSRSNFGKAFVRQFGLTPTEYVQMIKNA